MKVFIFLLLALNFKVHPQDLDGNRWLYSQEKKINGVAFVLHGLNTKPSAMDFIGHFLNRKGVHVFRGALTGHFGNVEELVSREIWLQDTEKAYTEALKKSQELKVPLYFVGYSLGALLFMDLVANSKKKIEVEKTILFSPALSIAAHLRFFSFIFYLPGSFKLPSRNLKEYRSSDYTTFAAYDALWKSYGHIDWKKITPPKALVIMDEDDELVSFGGIKYLVKKIPGWELFEVDTTGSRNSRQYHHLTFNDTCYAEGVWATIEERMENFLWPKPGTK
jgi:esterase/lipase